LSRSLFRLEMVAPIELAARSTKRLRCLSGPRRPLDHGPARHHPITLTNNETADQILTAAVAEIGSGRTKNELDAFDEALSGSIGFSRIKQSRFIRVLYLLMEPGRLVE
jgi:hypothetical protein